MLEKFNALLSFNNPLTDDEERIIADYMTRNLGGANQSYVELRQLGEDRRNFELILRVRRL